MSDKQWIDDAEFDAFLKGEHALSHELKSMPQPQSPAALDDAILQRVMAGLAGDARGAPAANDPGEQVQPRLTKSFSARWRVPVALAASVLFAVVGVRQWEGDLARQAATEQAATEQAFGQEPVEVAAPPAPPLADAAVGAPASVEAAPSVPRAAPKERSVVAARPSASARPPVPKAAAPAPVPVPVLEPMPVPMPAPMPSPAPAPMPSPAPAPPPPAPVQEVAAAPPPPSAARVEVTGSRVRRSDAEAASPVREFSRQEPAARRPRDAAMPPSYDWDKKGEAATKPSLQPSAVASPPANGPANQWLVTIDGLIESGEHRRALEEWTKFRAANPYHPVSDAFLARIKRLEE
ncbi:hypothetical protein [Massilia glaciei]|uniref:Uncharacterized protein n=1 Tax=Massilia glaciei TaxID=1524097 RepID=A0A2U2HMJ8_9BURK|nr:hypothetical protein [Massilia glaciei]PWF48723.1 hypothetical protein C7C56_010470 [Massilia glaciei]